MTSDTILATRADTLREAYDEVESAASILRAERGLQRLHALWRRRGMISAERVYQWLDPNDFVAEAEEVQARKAETLHRWRNVLAILPIIITYLSLAYAVFSYERLVVSVPGDIDVPFLKLWQEGFGGTDPIPLSLTALLAASILIAYVTLLAMSQEFERRARNKANDLARKLGHFLNQVSENDFYGSMPILPDSADLPTITKAIQDAIGSATASGNHVIDIAQANLEGLVHLYRENAEQVNLQTAGLIATMRDIVAEFNSRLSAFTEALNQLAPTSVNLVQATNHLANDLAGNAERYSEIGRDLDTHVADLSRSITALASQMMSMIEELGGISSDTSVTARLAREASENMQAAVGAMLAGAFPPASIASDLSGGTQFIDRHANRNLEVLGHHAADNMTEHRGIIKESKPFWKRSWSKRRKK